MDDALWDTTNIRSHSLVTDLLDDVSEEYLKRLVRSINDEDLSGIKKAERQFVYSAMHGVGYPYIKMAFKSASLEVNSDF